MQDTPAPPDRPAHARPLHLSPAWLVFAALALAVPIGALLFRAERPAAPMADARTQLPRLSSLPDFALIDQAGRPFARKDLLGRTWVADFVFTHCADACPRLTATMKELQDALSPSERESAVGLLSISVDPARDTPEAMRTYAQAHGADPRLWRFLTGDQTQIERAVVQGFKLGIEPAGDVHSAAFDIMHGEKFVLVDSSGNIRGYYDVNDAGELQHLLRDVRQLARGDL